MAFFYATIFFVFVSTFQDCIAAKEKSYEEHNGGGHSLSNPSDPAPNSSAIYIRHSDEPDEPIYMSDWMWQMLKEGSGCVTSIRPQGKGHGRSSASLNQTAFFIRAEGKTDEPIIFNAWFQTILLNPKGGSLRGHNITMQTAAYVNSSHPSHIGVPEPIYVNQWFAEFVSNPKAVVDKDTYNNSAAFFIMNPGKPAEEIYLNEWFWMVLHFRRN